MKTLYLMRHAKSDWSQGETDFDRGLNARGQRVAPLMAAKLKELDVKPELIVSSSAKRTRLTTDYLLDELNYPANQVQYTKAIYEAPTSALLETLQSVHDKYQILIMVGHNPGMSLLTEHLTGDNVGNMPTASVSKINLNIASWRDLCRDTGSLDWFIYPKLFNF